MLKHAAFPDSWKAVCSDFQRFWRACSHVPFYHNVFVNRFRHLEKHNIPRLRENVFSVIFLVTWHFYCYFGGRHYLKNDDWGEEDEDDEFEW